LKEGWESDKDVSHKVQKTDGAEHARQGDVLGGIDSHNNEGHRYANEDQEERRVRRERTPSTHGDDWGVAKAEEHPAYPSEDLPQLLQLRVP